MNKKALVIIILIILTGAIGIYSLFLKSSNTLAGLKVSSNVPASIFLNDVLIGKTDYEDKYAPGEYVIKIIPDTSSTQSVSWQGKINLVPSFLTYIKREFGPSELTSAGEIISLEKLPSSEAEIYVTSQPDSVSVLVDGLEKGVTPLLLKDIIPGEREIAVSVPGYISRTVRIQATSGYKLNLTSQLALNRSSEGSAAGELDTSKTLPSKEQPSGGSDKPFVTVKDTPTGFLRVRNNPSTQATEITQIKPGSKYPLLEEKEGWYKISLPDNKEGWIAARYAEK